MPVESPRVVACSVCGKSNEPGQKICGSCGASLLTGTEPTASGSAVTIALGVIADRYELLRIVGRGGAGVVYAARDRVLDETLAIKLLPTQQATAEEMERVKREIITARKISHPNVIRIHEFGLAGSDAFISMELLTGGTLAQRLKEVRPLPLKEAREIAIGICEGLAAAHAEEIVHRDLKPENILFDAHGRPKIVDFGLARLETAGGFTRGFSGTPLYMSPEQVNGQDITQQSDVYSLGVMLYEVFTGSLPFKADSLVQLALLHANAPPPPPRSLRPEIPPSLEAVLLHALEKDPQKRSTARKIAEDLRGDVHAGPARPAQPVGAPRPPPPRRSPPILAGSVVVAAGLAVWGLLSFLRPPPTPAGPPAATATRTATAVATATAIATATETATPVATPSAIRTPAVPSAVRTPAVPAVITRSDRSLTYDESTVKSTDGQAIRRRVPRFPTAFLEGCSRGDLESADETITRAIRLGAPDYNNGDIAACAQTYQQAADEIRSHLPEECRGPRTDLGQVLDGVEKLDTPFARAWALRDEFDGLQHVIHGK